MLESGIQESKSLYGVTCLCGYDFDMEDMKNLITYWGEDGPRDEECPNCEHKMTIEEHVERTFTISFS